jgi:hypothetical protein
MANRLRDLIAGGGLAIATVDEIFCALTGVRYDARGREVLAVTVGARLSSPCGDTGAILTKLVPRRIAWRISRVR